MPSATTRRLAGFRFEDRTPPIADVLPRMDIAVFVGFAAAGPLHLPVALESPDRFADVFGEDLPLAWDPAGWRTQKACLAPVVRAFFAGGGRRCWIIRVADEAAAETSVFVVPGLLRCDAAGRLAPALAPARAPGGWADAVRVGTALLSEPVVLPDLTSLPEGWLPVPPAAPDELAAGDLLRLRFPDSGWLAYFPIGAIAEKTAGSSPVKIPVALASRVVWLREARQVPPATLGGVATFLDPRGAPVTVAAAWSNEQPDGGAALDLPPPPGAAPAPGALVRAELGVGTLWLGVRDVFATLTNDSPPAAVTRVVGEAWWSDLPPPALPAAERCSVERLTFELVTTRGAGEARRLGSLGFAPGQERFWRELPADDALFAEADDQPRDPPALWRAAGAPRFPLAGPPGDPPGFFLPLGMTTLPTAFAGPMHSGKTRLEREGLGVFSAELFLDSKLTDQGVTALLGYADALRYLARIRHRPRGIHAALALEEATLIAVPDAIHPGWSQAPAPAVDDPPPSPPCHPASDELFQDCDRLIPPPPVLRVAQPADPSGSYTLAWTGPAESDAVFFLEESGLANFADAPVVASGGARETTLLGRAPGNYYYRVRVERSGVSSDWSNGIVVPVADAAGWVLNAPPSDPARTPELFAVQRALVRLCAARADLFALLSLPVHARGETARALVAQLLSVSGAASGGVPPLGFGERPAWSYAAVYHPWLETPDGAGDLYPVPPEGAIAGVFARRALTRGAWIAPANEPLTTVLALTPAIEPAHWLDLLTSRINLVRAEPTGFICLSADTLADDDRLRPINVRRLLILLRRLVLRLGATYVFEPNSDAFRRLVQHAFEAALLQLHQRGAFAGRTAGESFRINTGADANLPAGIDAGRFVVEIKIAPAQPMSFLTIRLVQTGERTGVEEIV